MILHPVHGHVRPRSPAAPLLGRWARGFLLGLAPGAVGGGALLVWRTFVVGW